MFLLSATIIKKDLTLRGDVAFGAKEQFENKAKIALRMV